MFPSGSAFPLLNNAASTVKYALAPLTETHVGQIAAELQSIDPNGVYAALPSLGLQPSGSVGQVAQTPEGNVTVPVTPATGVSPGEALYTGMGAAYGAATGADDVNADWRTAVRNEATSIANRVSPMGPAWSGFVRTMVQFAFASNTNTPAELEAKLPAEPFYTGFWQPSWPPSLLAEAQRSVASISEMLGRAIAADAGGGSAAPNLNWLSAAGSMGMSLPSGSSADELVDSVADTLPGGTVSEGEPVAAADAGLPPSTPPWVWVLGGAVALGVVGLGVAAMTRRKSST